MPNTSSSQLSFQTRLNKSRQERPPRVQRWFMWIQPSSDCKSPHPLQAHYRGKLSFLPRRRLRCVRGGGRGIRTNVRLGTNHFCAARRTRFQTSENSSLLSARTLHRAVYRCPSSHVAISGWRSRSPVSPSHRETHRPRSGLRSPDPFSQGKGAPPPTQ